MSKSSADIFVRAGRVAVYSGDSPNNTDVTHNARCSDDKADVVVTSVPSHPPQKVGTSLYGPVEKLVNGPSPQTVETSNTMVSTTSPNVSWSVSYESAKDEQRDIPASCHESTVLTITDGGRVSSP